MVSTELKTSMVIAARAARACDMCGKERARWYCAADEAYLCERCDESVHSANAVAKKHERARLGPDGAPAKLKASSHHNRKILSDDSNGIDINITPVQPQEADVKKWCNTSRKRSRTTRRSVNISGHPFLNSNAPVKLKPTNPLVTENKDDANLLFYDLLSADDHLVSHHSADSPPYEVKLEPVSPSSTLTSRDQPGMNLEGNDFTHEVPVYEPFLQDLMDSTEEDLMEKILPSSPSVGDVSCGSGASTSIINTGTLPSDCKAVKQKMSSVEVEGELNLSDLVDSSGGDINEDVSISEDSDIDTFDVMDLCSNANFVDAVKMEELNEDFSYTNAWKSTYRYEQGACASIFDGNPFKGKGERDCDLSLADVQHGKCLQQCAQQMGTHKPLSLHLNYEEVICAWSDRGSFWLDGQRPQMVPDINFMNHGIADCSMMIMTESQTNTSVCSQAGHVPSLVVVDKGREARVLRYKEKRRTRLFSKRIRYEVRKLNAERRPRMKGRFVKRAAMATLAAM